MHQVLLWDPVDPCLPVRLEVSCPLLSVTNTSTIPLTLTPDEGGPRLVPPGDTLVLELSPWDPAGLPLIVDGTTVPHPAVSEPCRSPAPTSPSAPTSGPVAGATTATPTHRTLSATGPDVLPGLAAGLLLLGSGAAVVACTGRRSRRSRA